MPYTEAIEVSQPGYWLEESGMLLIVGSTKTARFNAKMKETHKRETSISGYWQ
jgi:hypothetical protein